MLIKAYLKSIMFHLPMGHEDLLKRIQEDVMDGEVFIQQTLHKLHAVSKVENNQNIIVEKQRTNIILLNLLLNVYHYLNISITEPNKYDENFMIEELSRLTHLEVFESFDGLVKHVLNFYKSTVTATSAGNEETPQENSKYKEKSKDMKVEFNMSWVKNMNSKL